MTSKMQLTEEQVFDYIECPALFDMKYNKKIPYSKPITMPILLEELSRYFYSNLLNKKVCSMSELKKKWDSICKNNRDFVDAKKNIEGLNYIINLARWASENKLYLADFESSYILDFDSVLVSGVTGAISVKPGKICEILVSRFSNREPEQSDIDRRLKYTMDFLAFRQAYNINPQGIRVVHFKNLKEFNSHRTSLDFQRLKDTVIGVSKGIEAKSFYPRESSFCKGCFYKMHCKYWTQ